MFLIILSLYLLHMIYRQTDK